jgi:hypothetical protein
VIHLLAEKEYSVIDTHTAGKPTWIVTTHPEVYGATMADIKKVSTD